MARTALHLVAVFNLLVIVVIAGLCSQLYILKTCVFNIAVNRAFYVAFCDALLFIVGMFTAAKRYFHFNKSVFEIQFQRHKSIPLFIYLACDFGDFAFMQQ